MRQVQLHEEEQQFASLVAEAEAGESLTILRAGKPVAQIIPFPSQQSNTRSEEERLEAVKKLKALMKRGFHLDGFRIEDRAELYDRD